MMEKGFDVCLIFLDIRKAFDSVPHQPLIQHLWDIGINPHIVQWISSYLCQRTQRVVVGGASSDAMDVVSGVPQGSVLGPLLFLTYINRVANLRLSEGTRLSMYADDILLWKPIKQDSGYIHLQADLNLISSSISNLHLSLNATKFKYIVASRKKGPNLPSLGLYLDGEVMQQVVTWAFMLPKHSVGLSIIIQNVCSKTRKLVDMLYRQFYLWADTTTLRSIYITYIRPHLEYAAQLWDPHIKRDIQLLESVQRFACKVCLKCWDMDYVNMLHCLGLPTLVVRRQHLKLMTIYVQYY